MPIGKAKHRFWDRAPPLAHASCASRKLSPRESCCGDAEEQLYRPEGLMEDLGQEALFSRIFYQCDRITHALCGLMFEYGVQCGLRLAGTLGAFFAKCSGALARAEREFS